MTNFRNNLIARAKAFAAHVHDRGDNVAVGKEVRCMRCNGRGHIVLWDKYDTVPRGCATCNGTGIVKVGPPV